MTTLAMFKMIQNNVGFSYIGDLMKLYAGHSAPSPNRKPFHKNNSSIRSRLGPTERTKTFTITKFH